eukprot:gnl/TRDRNA2_/TRDRNA2_81908_c2_seq1.p1 gnl/TRDRNA2_/TRDRNA2_81908_c2~~gnl/TRDRNA2_/TRDRNA2_81908_c2_seq1.p1  ORF type:complete len:194 (+),score=31.65 gnl/TRDRNA2_/TRDRNA2_81908_c2_seq1:370-951(+)
MGLEEFSASLPLLREFGIEKVDIMEYDPYAAFQILDQKGGGIVSFDDFADFCLRNGKEGLQDGDDAERESALQLITDARGGLVTNTQIEQRIEPTASMTRVQYVYAAPSPLMNYSTPPVQSYVAAPANRQILTSMPSIYAASPGSVTYARPGGPVPAAPTASKSYAYGAHPGYGSPVYSSAYPGSVQYSASRR